MTDFNTLINSNTKTKETSASKKKAIIINEVPENVQIAIKNVIEGKKEKKIAESKIKKNEPVVIEHGLNLKDEKAYNGDYAKSYRLGNEEDNVNCVTSNKWSFKEEDVELIKEQLGDDADDMMPCDTEVVLDMKSIMNDPEKQKKFTEAFKDDFPEFFVTLKKHRVSSDFDEKLYKKGKEVRDTVMVYMKPAKPSLR